MAGASTPPSDHRLDQAVELRRRGATWELVAQRLHCSVETVRKWPLNYPARWQDAIRRTHAQLTKATEGEIVHSLRAMLQDESSIIRCRAARSILQLRLDRLKRCVAGKPQQPANKAGQAVTLIIALLQECSHGEITTVVAECLRLAKRLLETDAKSPEPVRPSSE